MSDAIDPEATEEAEAPDGAEPPRPPIAWHRRLPAQHAGALLLYLSVSLILFGAKVLPHMSTKLLTSAPTEASIFVWSLRWWPYAIGHGINPLFTHVVWAPTGLNLAWAATIPAPSLVLAPVTLALGPIAAFNVASLLIPAASSWTAYLLCRRLAGAFWPAVVGGAVFGFSPATMVELKAGHLNLSMLFVLPLCAYLVVRRLDETMSPRRFVALLTCCLVAEFGTFIEIFATMTVIGGMVGLAIFLFSPRERRPFLARTGGLIALSYGLALVVVSPYLYAMLAYPQALKPPGFQGLALGLKGAKDLLLYVVPGHNTVIGSSLTHGDILAKDPWYLGVPLVAILLHLWIGSRRRTLVKILAVGFLGAAVLALGPYLRLGHLRIPLPWRVLQILPLLGRARPGRLMAFGFLFAAVSLAVWLAHARRPALRWAVAALAMILLIPSTSGWTAGVTVPPFFTTGQFRRYLSPDDTVLVVDRFKGAQVYWQTATDFSFGLAGWYPGFLPPGYAYLDAGLRFESGHVDVGDTSELVSFISAHHVGAVIVGGAGAAATASTISSILGVAGQHLGGVWLLQLSPR